ncbi:MAG: GNAT family N-acetyltransferase [Planctomycetota bacterium]|nr:GNAT family N-acetyltransferase [Planctomycetaceae bacterium]MDQ3330326.1 GNAT family N-acetyltransferase [Planctomycetota bacterium]
MRIGFPRDESERFAALRCLFADDPQPAERAREALRLFASAEIDLRGLVGAWDDETAVAAGLFCKLPDDSAFVWPPVAGEDANDIVAVAAAILRTVTVLAAEQGCTYAQAAVDPSRADQCHALEASGFRSLALLRYLQRPLDRPLPGVRADSGKFLTFDHRHERRFEAVIERTYHGSLDCPGFTGLRSAADAIRSYQHSGEFTPQRWRLVENEGDDVAVILVNDRPDDRVREIVYLGVVPEARQQGIAQQLIIDSLAEAMADGCDAVLAAVDAANDPAAKLYSRLGFVPNFERAIYLWAEKSQALEDR